MPLTKILPLKSLYEKDGFIYNIENRLRKFYRAVTSPKNARSLDTILYTVAQHLPETENQPELLKAL